MEVDISSAQMMRALAHPARIAIMEYLGNGATATATECAEICDLSPSATSYHLRALEKFGLVEEAPSRGDGRERVWRSRSRGLSLDVLPADREEAQAARELARVLIERQDALTMKWLAGLGHEPLPWREEVIFNEATLLVTPAELNAVSKILVDAIRPYTKSRREDAPDEARTVKLIFRAIPTD
jgi:DNA-binding transcriptional ArsR family regulator